MSRVRWAFQVLVVLLSTGFLGWAQVATPRPQLGSRSQEEKHSLEALIVDSSGAPVYMARVVLSGFISEVGQTAFSDDDGRAFFYDLRQGTYQIHVSAAGFNSSTQAIALVGSQQVRIILIRWGDAAGTAKTGAATISVAEQLVPAKAREWFRKGMKELERKNYEKAIEHFKNAIGFYPQYSAAYAAMGIAYLQTRKTDLAQEAYAKAVELDGHLSDARLGLGLVYNDQKRYADAEKHLLEAERLNPADWHAQYELGRTYCGLDQFEKAEARLRRALPLQPNYPNLHLLLANVLVSQNKLAEGLVEMQEFLKLAPSSALAPQVREKLKLLKAELSKPAQQ